mgnify:CR=1 FL=1
MSLKSRIERLEDQAGTADGEVPEIIIIRALSKAGEDGGAYPGFASFVGFSKEELSALPGESNGAFATRAETRLAELKAAKIAEQKGQ